MDLRKRDIALVFCGMISAVCLLDASALRAQTAPKPDGPMIPIATGYKVVKKFPIPGEGGWDYLSVDPDTRHLYVSHGDNIEVLNADSGKILGQIPAKGAHGVAIASDLGHSFTSAGRDKSVTMFDSKTLAVIKTTKVNGTDGILYDPFTRRVFPMNEKISAIDAQTGDVVGEVDLNADPEGSATDGKGRIFINEADKKNVAVIDPKALTVTKEIPIGENCVSPHSLSYDTQTDRLMIGCANAEMVVLDPTAAKTVATSVMCAGVDSGGFDQENQLAFAACNEGVVTVVKEMTPDNFRIIETIPTQITGKTMGFDPKTKNIYVSVEDFQFFQNADPTKPPVRKFVPGTFKVLVVSRKKK